MTLTEQHTAFDAALDYLRHGWHVVPIPPGLKYPKGRRGWESVRADADLLRQWWDANPDHGLGILTGTASGIFVLDVDVADGKRGGDTLHDLETSYGPLPATVTVITGSGGQHHYFELPEGMRVPNSAGNVLGPGLDIRGEGGQVVAPPTIHPCGRAYMFEDGAGPDDTAVAKASGWLVALIGKAAEQEEAAAHRHEMQRARTDATGDRPGDRWAAQTTWAEILQPDGWTLGHIDRDGESHWVRPGKERRQGTSATTGYKGSDVLKVFTSSVPLLDADATYDKLGYLAATRHGGNIPAAARALAAKGYGTAVVADDLARFPVFDTSKGTPKPETRDDPWPAPTPFDRPPSPPEWPTGILSDWIDDQVANAAEAIQCAPDIPATFALGALSAIALGHVEVRVRAGQTEPPSIYLVAVAPPSEGKSPSLRMMMAPAYDHEAWMMASAASEVAEADQQREVLERRQRKLVEVAAKPDAGQSAMLDLADVAADLAKLDRPPSGRLIVTDTTPERLATLMAENGERIAIVSDEGGSALAIDRYRDANRPKNMDLWLQAWAGDRCVVERQTAPSVALAHPLLAVAIGAQPATWAMAMDDPEFRYRGLGARFMSVHPGSQALTRSHDIDRDTWDEQTADVYHRRMTELARRLGSWLTPATIRLSGDARRAYSAWAQSRAWRFAPGGDVDHEAEWASKMRDSVLRASVLLHLADGADPGQEVPGDVMGRACRLGDHWTAHRAWEPDPTWRDAERLLTTLVRLLADAEDGLVTMRMIGRGGSKGLRTRTEIASPMELLVAHGWVRIEGSAVEVARSVEAALRGAEGVRVHPDLTAQPVDNVLAGVTYQTVERPDGSNPTTSDSARQGPTESEGDHGASTSVGHVGHVGIYSKKEAHSHPFSQNEGVSPEPPEARPTRPTTADHGTDDNPPVSYLFTDDDDERMT